MAPSVEVPESVGDVIGALAGDGSVVLAGGTVVMPELNTTAHDFAALVSLRRAGLGGIEVDGGRAVIGAATTLAAVGKDERLAVLAPVIESIASPTIRNLATVGGNLFVRPALRRPRGRAARAGRRGRRRRPGRERRPARRRRAARRRRRAGGRHGRRLRRAPRRRLALHEGDAPQAELGLDRHRRRGPRLRRRHGGRPRGSPSAAPARKPVRAAAAEQALAGGPLDHERATAAGEAALRDAEPFDDAYASAWYRAPRPPRPRPPRAARGG